MLEVYLIFIDILRVWIDTNSSSQPELLMAPKKSKAKVKPEDDEGKDDRVPSRYAFLVGWEWI